MPKCDRCGFKRSEYEDYRFWTGSWTIREEGEVKKCKTICDDCHDDLFR